jgi:hypothetical protein
MRRDVLRSPFRCILSAGVLSLAARLPHVKEAAEGLNLSGYASVY